MHEACLRVVAICIGSDCLRDLSLMRGPPAGVVFASVEVDVRYRDLHKYATIRLRINSPSSIEVVFVDVHDCDYHQSNVARDS